MSDPPSYKQALAKSGPRLQEAWSALQKAISAHGSMLVSFSGGADSGLLLAAANAALPGRVVAALCLGNFTPPWEAKRARRMTGQLGVKLIELDAAELDIPAIQANGPLRCYHCKHLRLTRLKEMAREMGLEIVAEGSQLDDAQEDRPGSRAIQELGVASPLAQAGLDKAMVRDLSRCLGLATAETPSSACLASRIPQGRPIEISALERIARAEEALRTMLPGCQLRVRDHHPMARLELDPSQLPRAAAEPTRQAIVQAMQEAGYLIVCLDLMGYRSGGAQDANQSNELIS